MVVVDDELEEDETYKIIVYAVMHDDEYASSSSRKAAQLLVDQVESRLSGCEGVTVEIACLKPEAEITLSDLRLLKRWDFDYLSLRDPDSEDLPRH
ncbi:hypothetical protein DSM3645_10352 [Blastopirellula marina DSM 3645]|uniref:Uncharacterized protein n=2 Tax=Blastopirellula marina TaxID=124 RepID=A3ZM11_9BACT|nr:hypothetical protein DSM3645_10352 [Blastopirellula marina DSM 3645]